MGRVLPILFNTDMVRAILDGRKTVTRRVMKPQPWKIGKDEYVCKHEKGFFDMGGNGWACRQCGCGVIPMKGGSYFHAPYQPGDILYVRETYCPNYFDFVMQYGSRHGYKADYDKAVLSSDITEPKWTPSIHMPKEAARIWLKVTDVRVERLQEITPEQVIKEGITEFTTEQLALLEEHYDIPFAALWDSTVKKSDMDIYSWKSNPWVWVIEFERCEKPEC